MKHLIYKPAVLFSSIAIILLSLSSGCGAPSISATPSPSISATSSTSISATSSTSISETPSSKPINQPGSVSTTSTRKPLSTTISASNSQAMYIIQEASKVNKYTFLVFYKQNDTLSETMRQIVATFQKEVASRADAAYVDIANLTEKTLMDKYQISRAPTPITLVIAPNNAVVKAFPETVTQDKLRTAFVSPKVAEILKSTQNQKLVFLYIANSTFNYYKENLSIIQDTIRTDYKTTAEIIEVNPADPNEADLLTKCKITVPVMETNLLIINGGSIVGRLLGKFDKPTLQTTTNSSCSGGSCGPGGCN